MQKALPSSEQNRHNQGMYILALIIAALPWLAGGFICLALLGHSQQAADAANESQRSLLPNLFLFGVGGLLGYLVLAYALWALDMLGLPALSPPLIATLAVSSLLSAWFTRGIWAKRPVRGTPWSGTERILLAILVALFVVALYLQYHTPLFAWDGLNYWVSKAGLFIAHSTNLQESAGYTHAHKHPGTIVMIAAWAGWVGSIMHQQVWPTPWLLCMASICLMAAAYVYRGSGDKFAALITALLLATMPLVAHHYLATGYAELWLGAVILAGTLLAAMGLNDKRHGVLTSGLLVCGLALTIKNTGAAYALIPWLATALILFGSRLKIGIPLLLVLAALAAAPIFLGFDVTIAGVRSAWLPDESRLVFAGYNNVLQLYPLTDVAINEWYSLIVNQSFSMAALLFVFTLASFAGKDRHITIDSSLSMIVVTAGGLLLMLVVSQLLLPHGFRYAVPGNDTGNSRFSIPFALLVVPAALLALARLLKPRVTHPSQA